MAKRTATEGEAPETVTVEALEAHTYNGDSYEVGDTYDIDAQLVDSVTFQGKAVRVDRVEVARAAAKAAKASKPVEPMTTTSKSSKALAKPRKSRK